MNQGCVDYAFCNCISLKTGCYIAGGVDVVSVREPKEKVLRPHFFKWGIYYFFAIFFSYVGVSQRKDNVQAQAPGIKSMRLHVIDPHILIRDWTKMKHKRREEKIDCPFGD